jgi:hypothetical protein
MIRQVNAWKQALSPHLAAITHRLVQRVGYPIHIDPPRGKA